MQYLPDQGNYNNFLINPNLPNPNLNMCVRYLQSGNVYHVTFEISLGDVVVLLEYIRRLFRNTTALFADVQFDGVSGLLRDRHPTGSLHRTLPGRIWVKNACF